MLIRPQTSGLLPARQIGAALHRALYGLPVAFSRSLASLHIVDCLMTGMQYADSDMMLISISHT